MQSDATASTPPLTVPDDETGLALKGMRENGQTSALVSSLPSDEFSVAEHNQLIELAKEAERKAAAAAAAAAAAISTTTIAEKARQMDTKMGKPIPPSSKLGVGSRLAVSLDPFAKKGAANKPPVDASPFTKTAAMKKEEDERKRMAEQTERARQEAREQQEQEIKLQQQRAANARKRAAEAEAAKKAAATAKRKERDQKKQPAAADTEKPTKKRRRSTKKRGNFDDDAFEVDDDDISDNGDGEFPDEKKDAERLAKKNAAVRQTKLPEWQSKKPKPRDVVSVDVDDDDVAVVQTVKPPKKKKAAAAAAEEDESEDVRDAKAEAAERETELSSLKTSIAEDEVKHATNLALLEQLRTEVEADALALKLKKQAFADATGDSSRLLIDDSQQPAVGVGAGEPYDPLKLWARVSGQMHIADMPKSAQGEEKNLRELFKGLWKEQATACVKSQGAVWSVRSKGEVEERPQPYDMLSYTWTFPTDPTAAAATVPKIVNITALADTDSGRCSITAHTFGRAVTVYPLRLEKIRMLTEPTGGSWSAFESFHKLLLPEDCAPEDDGYQFTLAIVFLYHSLCPFGDD